MTENRLLFVAVSLSIPLFLAIAFLPQFFVGKTELGVVETATEVFYLAGLLICVIRLWNRNYDSRLMVVFWGSLCFIFFGEWYCVGGFS